MVLMPVMMHAQTLQQCQDAAQNNYPLINQYGLIEKTTDATVDNIQKGWLPQVSAYALATYQSDVASWPESMQGVFQTMGVQLEGLHKDQYRVGIDINQSVFDGGVISSQKEMAKRQGEVMTAQNEVTLYQIRKRVNDMFFSLLLIDEQIILSQDLQTLLGTNEKKLASMFQHGTAAESDYYAVKAERLNVGQQLTTLQTQRRTLQRMLAVSTVYTHLEHFVKEGKIDVFKLIDKRTFNTVKSAIDIVGTWVLSRIKENCPDNINYSEIRLVVAHLDHKNGKKTTKHSIL